ncbi:MAG: M48 family metalloprotease [Proteobacteria bacterium]|nr:M48 family metalloprotease [Pseudomonadota bacterium]
MCFKTFIALSLIFVSACAPLTPERGKGSPYQTSSEKEDRHLDPRKEIGREFLSAIRKELEFVNEPEVVSLVNRVGKHLVRAAGNDPDYYHFFVVKNNQINAFAVPGGYIFIYDGLLKNIDSVDALAGVLAHEIAHIERDHVYRNAKKSGIVDLATIAAIILGGVSGDSGAAKISIAQAANISMKLQMSRELEEDADIFAIKYLRRSRYNLTGLSDLLKTLAYYERFSGADMLPPYLSTHPGVGSRLVTAEVLSQDLPVDEEEKALAQWDWRRIVTILNAENREGHGLSLKGNGDDKKMFNKEREHYLHGLYALKSQDLKKARTEYLEAIRLNPNEPLYHSDMAMLYLQLKHMELAKVSALKSLELSNSYAAPHIVLAMAAKSEGNHEEAIKQFKEAEKMTPYDTFIHYQMGDCYHAFKKPVLMRLHLARFYRYNIKPENALMQLHMALEETEDKELIHQISAEILSIKRDGI